MTSEQRYRKPFVLFAIVFLLGTVVGFFGGELVNGLMRSTFAPETENILADGYVMEAYDLFDAGNVTGAIASASRAIEYDPTSYSPHVALGTFYSSIGANKQAVAALERALELVENSTSVGAKHDLTIIEEKLEELTNAG